MFQVWNEVGQTTVKFICSAPVYKQEKADYDLADCPRGEVGQFHVKGPARVLCNRTELAMNFGTGTVLLLSILFYTSVV